MFNCPPGLSFEGARFQRSDGDWDVVKTGADGVTRIHREAHTATCKLEEEK